MAIARTLPAGPTVCFNSVTHKIRQKVFAARLFDGFFCCSLSVKKQIPSAKCISGLHLADGRGILTANRITIDARGVCNKQERIRFM